MKKLSIIVWIILGSILLLAVAIFVFPMIFKAAVILEAFAIFMQFLQGFLRFVIVVMIAIAIIFWLTQRGS